ncbi:protein MODIFIER OF SNC1 1 [Salvia miltiorrhiza]|uniref:protein MODIFIER OF SNC1 1 n=1 Tax=Salvia miltiorrhiza TaxID=226208 RepID=UPI0025AD78D6|nr:protein MODIFIER OF SNC1 1 [Salvia miltiorrhiza]XP_057786821.1 protein MODIFIER OF SNC1 1 [Salvia miltiorrhiza]XP_057786822.1 protein MODIFIER OF SNC1 1 [Salvia miltiorrhiza]XP_057786823.1 protein MODIFIER OF SNC1 1 [Salvia miltiorrhiza]
MNSSMLAGERRWASARRGGMTVLGKVAVPKPINLPSQRLENHGLDPNVEIVPKGTVSWGSRSSSSGSSPWTSSSLSPNADGGTVSPSHLSGRPSSGGSGTRPSTSGSDRTHDHAPNAWSANSRPSSASGTLSSNQTTSSSLRPRSAENRPNSSQLSRFAESVSKTSAPWGSNVTAERLGVKSLKEDSFSLTSGDFPTLGSEKANSVKNVESEDSRPSSASGRIVQANKEDNIPHADVKHGTVNTWRAETQHAEDDIHPSMEKWQGDPHQYYPNTAPQRFEGWRGPPMNGPTGGWYGGRPRGPAFGAHVPPGGFPMEPFPYYRPQIPPPPLAGSQPVPQPGPRGPHPKNGDLYRPQMHEAYPRPGMQFRPNFYPGPPGPMPFEGYYGPPMGYCNNERDMPYMGMPTGPPVYNGYPAPAPDISNSHGRASGRGPTGKTMSEQVETGHPEETRAPKRVPLNIHNEYEQKEEGDHWEQHVPPNISHPGKIRFPPSCRKTEWGAEEDAEEAVSTKRMALNQNPSNSHGNRIHSADNMKVKAFEGMGNTKGLDDNWTNKSEGPLSFPSVVPQCPVANDRDAIPATTKNSALIHKIDGLNAKFRVSDGWSESTTADNREKEWTGSQIVDMKVNNGTREVGNAAAASHRAPVSRNCTAAPDEMTVPVGDNPMHPIAVIPRRSYHGGQPRVDHRGKGKFNSQEADGWRRKPLSNDSSSAVMASNAESIPNIHSRGPNIVGEASENSKMDPVGKAEGDSAEVCDSADIQAQRAKMKELAKQRYLQLQKEEEERVREQKAKALAKLEELDRRKLAGEAANQKAERTPIIGDVRVEQQEVHTVIGTVVAELKTNESGFNLVLSPAVASWGTDNNTNQAGESVEESRDLHPPIQQKGLVESNVSSLPKIEDSEDVSAKKVLSHSQPDDGGISRHKRAGYKQKQNNLTQKHLNENAGSSSTLEAQKDHTLAAVADMHEPPSSDTRLSESNLLNISNTVVEPSVQQRKRINRNNKPKPKPEETPTVSAIPPVTSDITHGSESIDNGGSNDSVSNLGAFVSTVHEPDTSVHTRELSSCLPSEESQSKVPTQWKQNRRIPKNQQAHRFTDKHHGSDTVVWAPKAKGSDEMSQNSLQESANSMKSNNVAQNSLKGKRAEMERYVPKPQLAQQGSSPPLPSSVRSSRSTEGVVGEQSGSSISANSQPVSSSAAANVGDSSSHSKNKKDHGTWKQRGSTDPSQTKSVPTGPTDISQVKGAHTGPSPVSEPMKEVQQSKEIVQSGRSESNRANAETKISGGNYATADTTTAAVSKHPSVKDQGATGRGKRHPPRGPRSGGNNPDFENTLYGEVDGSSSSALDVNQMDKSIIAKENRSFGERTSSHWQRKSSPNSASNQQGNRNAGSESVTLETNRIPRKGTPQHMVQSVPQHDKESSNSSQPHLQPGQSVNVKSNVADDSVARRHQNFDREKKPDPVKGRPYSPNQDPVGSDELPLSNTNDLLEHNVTSGSRRTGRQNNRPVRVHESRGEWSSGFENRPHNAHAFRDRQRQNVHLEYQPVGPLKGYKPEKVEELADGGADSMDQRHRERGQSHSKRGGNYNRR